MKTLSKNDDLNNVNKCICIAHNYSEDSISGMSYHLAHYFTSKGYNVLYISHKPSFGIPFSVTKENGNIYVYAWPEKRPTGIKSLIWFVRIYLRHKPNSLIGHFVGGNTTAIVIKILSGFKTKTCIYYHTISSFNIAEWKGSNFKRKLFILRKRLFYKFFADLIICPSELARDDFKKTYIRSKKCEVLLNPLKDRYSKTEKTYTDDIVVSYLGRFEKSKGILELLNAFIEYSGSKSHSKIRLQIAGCGSLTDEIISICQNNNAIHLKGTIPYNEVDNYLRLSDYVIIPSLIDNLPTVGIESIMNGVPLLLSTQTGLAQYLEDNVNCYLFQPSVLGILGVLKKVEIKHQNNYNNMTINARKIYLEKFTLKGYYSRMTELLNLHINTPDQNY